MNVLSADYEKAVECTPLLTRDDEVRLGRAIRTGVQAAAQLQAGDPDPDGKLRALVQAGEDAKEQFIRANLRLVIRMAYRHRRPGVPVADAIQDGHLGLLTAVDKFDPERGFKFSTYATWWIHRHINAGSETAVRTIRLTASAQDLLRRALAVETVLTEQNLPVTVEVIASELGTTVDRLLEVYQAASAPVSLDSPNGDGTSLMDLIAADEDEDGTDPQVLEEALSVLHAREREIIELLYPVDGTGCTRREVARRYGISSTRVGQIEAAALAKMRNHLQLLERTGRCLVRT